MDKVTIDVIGKDGRPVIADLEGASPTGGLVTSDWKQGNVLAPGDVIRYRGRWMVVIVAATNKVTGITKVIVRGPVLEPRSLILADGMGVEARTDCRIDPDTLGKIDGLAAA